MKHTKEPWDFIVEREPTACMAHICKVKKGKDYKIIADVYGKNSIKAAEDARRIVACVNACKGFSTEDIEKESLNLTTTTNGESIIQIYSRSY